MPRENLTDWNNYDSNTNVIPYIIELVKIKDRKIRDQVIWCAGNIAGEGNEYRDILVERGFVNSLVKSLFGEINYEKRNLSYLRSQTWTLNNFMRRLDPKYSSVVFQCLPALKLLLNISDSEIISNTAWCLNYGTRTLRDIELISFIEFNILTPDRMKLLKDGYKISIPFIRTLGNIIAGPNQAAQTVLDLGVLNYMDKLFELGDPDITKELCWIISNIAAGTLQQASTLVSNKKLLDYIVRLLSSTHTIRKECAYVICNIASKEIPDWMDYLVNRDCIELLCENLKSKDTSMLSLVLDSLFNILKYTSYQDKVKSIIEETGG